MYRETFFDIIFYIFDKWGKRVQKKHEANSDEKNINPLRSWSTKASKVSDKIPLLEWVLFGKHSTS